MNRPQLYLFELIYSLTASEKRYVTKHLKGNRESHSASLRLFQALEKVREKDDYDEKAISADAKVKNLPSLKRYLFYSILSALRNLKMKRSVSLEVIDNISFTQILVEREIFQAAAKTISRARFLVEKYELGFLHPVVIRHERILLGEGESGRPENHLRQISLLEEEMRILCSEQLRNKLSILSLKTGQVLNHDYCYTHTFEQQQNDADIFQNRFDEILEEMPENPPLHILFLVESIRSNLSYYSGVNKVKMASYFQRIYFLMLANTWYKKRRPNIFAKFKLIYVTDTEKLNFSLREISEYIQNNIRVENQRTDALASVLLRRIEFCIIAREEEEGWKTVAKLEELLLNKGNKLSPWFLMQLMSPIYQFYFVYEEFSISLKWVNKLLQLNNRFDYEIDLLPYEIAFSIIHFELGNYEFNTEYILGRIRSWKRKGWLVENEIKFMKSILAIAECLIFSNRKQLFRSILKEVGWESHYFGRNVISKSIFKAWVLSRIDDKPIIDHAIPLISEN